ncbi:MAG: hypothetical protein Q7R87_01575 [Nanoarchaeota archaeon]|nr:hypothetical protein [Nanoarchaeota archaeon]
MSKEKNLKIKLNNNRIILPLHFSQGGIRIADKQGNHVQSPTKANNENRYYIEWMITNDEIELISRSVLKNTNNLIEVMKKINKFAGDSDYSKRITSKTNEKEIAIFEEFKIYQYSDIFNSFEKNLNSGLKVRLTFKLGDYGISAHPHMYVLVPFEYGSLRLKNNLGDVKESEKLGSGCFGELILNSEDLNEIILTLAHASKEHCESLINILK